MAGRKPYTPTPEHIETVRALKEKGASDKSCAEAIGISRFTFNKYKNTIFTQPIKKAEENRIQTHLKLAQDALALRLQQRTVTETTTTTRTIGDTETTEEKVTEKVIQPSDTLIMFTLVNKSEGEWQSINKVDTTVNTHNTVEIPTINFTKPK